MTITDGLDRDMAHAESWGEELGMQKGKRSFRELVRASVDEVISEIADFRRQLAGLRESAEASRDATTAKVDELVAEIADLRTQVAALQESAEASPAPSESYVRTPLEVFPTEAQPLAAAPITKVESSKVPTAFRWPSVFRPQAIRVSRLLPGWVKHEKEELLDSDEMPPKLEVTVALKRLHKMLQSDELAARSLTIASDNSPDDHLARSTRH